MMRVTQSMMFGKSAGALQSQYQQLARVQEQSISGSRVATPSDDPAATYRHLLLSSDLSSVKSLQKTTNMAVQRFTMAESNIGTIHDKLLDAQDLILQMGNSTAEGLPQVMEAASEEALAWYQDVMKYVNDELDGVPIFSGGKTRAPFDETNLAATAVKTRIGDSGSFITADATQFSAAVTGTPDDVPLGIKVLYRDTDSTGAALATPVYTVDVNGVTTTVDSTGVPQTIDAATGVTFTVNTAPSDGDAYFFEVVPQYQGGTEDRLVKIADGRNLSGNVTGADLVEGNDPPGRGINMLGALAGLRGSLIRADHKEVNAWLSTIQEARAQASDLQAITGIRAVQAESIHTTLSEDQSTLEETRAGNIEVDVFEVMSRLEQTTQSLELITLSQREVINTSLLDFIR